MENYVIAEEYTLPSLGKVYDQQVNPNIKIRSMTTEEEMKRLGRSDRPNKLISEIIDDCLIVKPGISSYDMCIGDYQFLLHKLRVVTYGSDYPVESYCRICGSKNTQTINLEELNVIEYSEDLDQYLHITLPISKKNIDLKMQTPRSLDDINIRATELLKKSKDFKGDPAFLFTLESLIDKVDGQVLNPAQLETFIRSLPMRDTNYIIKSAEKINIGLDMNLHISCDQCGGEYDITFPITGEFFGPSID